jgi:hypothetical protein
MATLSFGDFGEMMWRRKSSGEFEDAVVVVVMAAEADVREAEIFRR